MFRQCPPGPPQIKRRTINFYEVGLCISPKPESFFSQETKIRSLFLHEKSLFFSSYLTKYLVENCKGQIIYCQHLLGQYIFLQNLATEFQKIKIKHIPPPPLFPLLKINGRSLSHTCIHFLYTILVLTLIQLKIC